MKKTTVRIFVCVLFICLGCLQSYALAGMPIDDCENNERYANSYGGNVVLEISNTGIAKATARAAYQRRNSKNKCFYAIGTLNERSVGKNTDLEWFNKLY